MELKRNGSQPSTRGPPCTLILGVTKRCNRVPLFADRLPSMTAFARSRRALAEDQHAVARCDRLRAVRDDDASELQLLDGAVDLPLTDNVQMAGSLVEH